MLVEETCSSSSASWMGGRTGWRRTPCGIRGRNNRSPGRCCSGPPIPRPWPASRGRGPLGRGRGGAGGGGRGNKPPAPGGGLRGPADPAPVADLARTRTIGTRRVGNVGALGWVAEQLNVVRHLNEAFAAGAVRAGPSAGELILAVAVQRACAPGSERGPPGVLGESAPR